MIHQSNYEYDSLSKAFHWVTAVAVIVTFILGPEDFGRLMRDGVDPATKIGIILHETLGMSIFLLTLLRLLWASVRPAVRQVQMASWMQWASKFMHWILWGLLLALPATAVLALGSESNPLTLLGGVRIDQMPLITNSSIAELADWGEVHQFLGDAIIWLAGLHALAAIFHHWILKDKVLLSMLPFKQR